MEVAIFCGQLRQGKGLHGRSDSDYLGGQEVCQSLSGVVGRWSGWDRRIGVCPERRRRRG
jgi:hypothetical protein